MLGVTALPHAPTVGGEGSAVEEEEEEAVEADLDVIEMDLVLDVIGGFDAFSGAVAAFHGGSGAIEEFVPGFVGSVGTVGGADAEVVGGEAEAVGVWDRG